MTTNPKWPEILHSLFPGQTATDCPDIVLQIFEQKKKVLLKLIDNGFFGTTIAHIHTIEFQKRDLPHIHLLIFLHSQDHIRDPHHINSMILAQLPDPQLQPLLYAKVTKYMLYGPYGANNPQAKCMVNEKYSKHFPKEYRERTDWAENSYPLYARSDNGLVFECNGARFTNQYVVLYCPQLLFLFDCHISVEISAGLGTVKYLSKYIYKGPDRATMEISSRMQDEIKAHLDGHFISPTEACWKIFEFNMHEESLAVQYLPIHLPNEYYVNFHAHQSVNEVLARQNVEKTQLTAWFDYNSTHDDSLGFTYWQFPQHYTWNAKDKSWHSRQCARVIGRMYFVSPSKGEQFFL